MKNINITNYIKKKTAPFILAGTIILPLIGCGGTNEKEKEVVVHEGILTIGDEIFLIKYLETQGYANTNRLEITLTDGKKLVVSRSNFYEYDENAETVEKIKKLVIEENHVIE